MLFEVEHSTNIQNPLLKFTELQDFYVKFYIVADEARKREFESKLLLNAFVPIQKRVQFMSYNQLSDLHTKTSIESSLDL